MISLPRSFGLFALLAGLLFAHTVVAVDPTKDKPQTKPVPAKTESTKSESNTAAKIEPAPDGRVEATRAIATFRAPRGFKIELFAAEPELRHPIAFCLDEQGRVYVAEEHRFNRGTEENRKCSFLLDDDLQCNSIEDRLKMYQKYADRFKGGMDWFTKHGDQVRQLVDSDGDGVSDRSTIFAGGFNDPLAGLGSGVIARDGVVYYTCIPDLWKLQDTDGDGVAEQRKSLSRGYGTNCAYLGHDLHGLVWGPPETNRRGHLPAVAQPIDMPRAAIQQCGHGLHVQQRRRGGSRNGRSPVASGCRATGFN